MLAGDLIETHFVTGVRERLHERALPRATGDLDVVSSEFADRSGILGLQAMVVDTVYLPEAVDRELEQLPEVAV